MSKNKFKPIEVSLESDEELIKTVAKEAKEEEVKPTFDFPNLALGIYLKENGKYALVEIPFDPVSGDVGFIKELNVDVFEDIADRFKVNASEKLLTRKY